MSELIDEIANVVLEGFDKAIHSKSKALRNSFIVLFTFFELTIIIPCTYFGIVLFREKSVLAIILLAIAFVFSLGFIYFIYLLRSRR